MLLMSGRALSSKWQTLSSSYLLWMTRQRLLPQQDRRRVYYTSLLKGFVWSNRARAHLGQRRYVVPILPSASHGGKTALLSSVFFVALLGLLEATKKDEKVKEKILQGESSEAKFANESLADHLLKKNPVLNLSDLPLSSRDLQDLFSWLESHYHPFMRVVWGEVEADCEGLVSTVEEKIYQNCERYEDRPKPYTCAQFASLAYSSVADLKKEGALPENWVYLTSRDSTKIDGYFGVAFINHDTRQIILAHRGTKLPIKDLITDVLGIVMGVVEGQQESAIVFTNKIIQAAEECEYRLGFVGHSLGGWLAQLTAYWCKVRGIDDVYAVTLDTPGAKEMLETYLQGRAIIPMATGAQNDVDFTHYLSLPNIVNCCNEQRGDLIHIDPQFYSAEKKWQNWVSGSSWLGWVIRFQKDIEYLLETHSSENQLATFDPNTGMPRDELVYKVVTWPNIRKMGKYSVIFNRIACWNREGFQKTEKLVGRERFTVEEIAKFSVEKIERGEIGIQHFSPRAQVWLQRMAERNEIYFSAVEERAGLDKGVLTEKIKFQLDEGGRVLTVNTPEMDGWEFRNTIEKLLKIHPELHLLATDLDLHLSIEEIQVLLDSPMRELIHFCEDIILSRLYLFAPASKEEIQLHRDKKQSLSEKIEQKKNLLDRFKGKESWLEELQGDIAQLEILREMSVAFILYKSRLFNHAKNQAVKILDLMQPLQDNSSKRPEQFSRIKAGVYSLMAKIDRSNWQSEEDLISCESNYKKALDHRSGLPKVASLWSNYGALLNNWGEWLFWEGKKVEALEKHQKALELHKKAHALVFEGEWLFQVGEHKELPTGAVLRDYARGLFLLAETQHALKLEVIESRRKALEVAHSDFKEPSVINSELDRCEAENIAKELLILENEYQKELKRILTFFSFNDPATSYVSPTTWLFKGIIHKEMKETEKSLECYLFALKQDPNHVTLLNRLAEYYQIQGDLQESLKFAQRSYDSYLQRGIFTPEDKYRIELIEKRLKEIKERISYD